MGHQKHGDEVREEYKNNPTFEYTEDSDNIQMMEELRNGAWKNWDKNDTGKRTNHKKSWLQLGRILSGNRNFTLDNSEIWESIAFCNFLQVPDYNIEARQGKDEESLYIYSQKIFKEYLEEIEPDKIIVWGGISYPYISALGEKIDDKQCKIILPSGKTAYVLQINHPSRIETGGYDVVIQRIHNFLKQY